MPRSEDRRVYDALWTARQPDGAIAHLQSQRDRAIAARAEPHQRSDIGVSQRSKSGKAHCRALRACRLLIAHRSVYDILRAARQPDRAIAYLQSQRDRAIAARAEPHQRSDTGVSQRSKSGKAHCRALRACRLLIAYRLVANFAQNPTFASKRSAAVKVWRIATLKLA